MYTPGEMGGVLAHVETGYNIKVYLKNIIGGCGVDLSCLVGTSSGLL